VALPTIDFELVLWLIAITLVLATGAYFVLRWIAFRIASRLAVIAEARLAARLEPGLARSQARFGRPLPPVPPMPPMDDARRRRYLAELDRFAWLMDRVIPLPIIGGVGLDALLGLAPVLGDVVSLSISSLIIVRAAQMGAPPALLSRLVAILCVDLLLGAVPVIGDLVDAGYHANERSVDLLKKWVAENR
jgi:hypothetical protein